MTFIAVLFLFFPSVECKRKVRDFSDQEEILNRDYLLSLLSHSKTDIIDVDANSMNEYAIYKPRDYNVIAVFDGSSAICPACKAFQPIIKGLGGSLRRADLNATNDPVFILRYTLQQKQEDIQYMQKLGITYLPAFIWFPKSEPGTLPCREVKQINKQHIYKLPGQYISSQHFGAWVTKRTGLVYASDDANTQQDFTLTPFIFFVIVGTVTLCGSLVFYLYTSWGKKALWTIVPIIVVLYSISGFPAWRINQSPFFLRSGNNRNVYFYPQDSGRIQLGSESFIMAFFFLVCGACLVVYGVTSSPLIAFVALATGIIFYLMINLITSFKN
ncbi:putative oligosaccharyltransferase complex subunit gamma [Blattamonas nauphoetae]|uniref:Oligosaccharyltransferase complex subunit gamma n=1 Tax=Blattamonas nauphoetae TaxID=2049346 RepID=A0ABQ9XXQ2_9EUKA|nr:putative oligosaccharyltransferase complex subunit gamma [Blattamonas nauphoetae]